MNFKIMLSCSILYCCSTLSSFSQQNVPGQKLDEHKAKNASDVIIKVDHTDDKEYQLQTTNAIRGIMNQLQKHAEVSWGDKENKTQASLPNNLSVVRAERIKDLINTHMDSIETLIKNLKEKN